jgi:hypothetical protein
VFIRFNLAYENEVRDQRDDAGHHQGCDIDHEQAITKRKAQAGKGISGHSAERGLHDDHHHADNHRVEQGTREIDVCSGATHCHGCRRID